jgi:c-di-GMP-binding flagellar brake protein YcgR
MGVLQFKINQKLSIALDTDKPSFQSTHIQDMNNHTIHVLLPFVGRIPLRVQKGDRLLGKFFVGNAVCEFETQVLGVSMNGKVPLLIFEKPARIHRVQRREFFRQNCLLPMEYSFAHGVTQDYAHFSTKRNYIVPWYQGTIVDISGGGIRFSAERPIPLESELLVRFAITNGRNAGEIIETIGKVMRVEKSRNATVSKFYSLTFIQIAESVQDLIVNFVFSMAGSKTY